MSFICIHRLIHIIHIVIHILSDTFPGSSTYSNYMIQSARIIYKFKIPFHDSSVSNHRDKICSANLAPISGRRHNKKKNRHTKTFFQTLFAYGSFLLLCSDQLQLSKCCCDDCHRIYFRSVTSTGQIVDWCI